MKIYLFQPVPTRNCAPCHVPGRNVLNDVIETVNKWTREGSEEDKKVLVLAEIDLVRRIAKSEDRVGDWYFKELDALTLYVQDGTHPVGDDYA